MVRIFLHEQISHTTDHFKRDDNHATAACESSLFHFTMFNNRRAKRTFRFYNRAVSALVLFWFADYSYLLFARQPLFFTFLKLFYFVSFAT